MSRTMIDLIETFSNDDSISIIHNGEQISYAQFHRDIVNLASDLSSSYESKKNHMAILSDDNYKFLVGIYAVMYSGNVAVPVDTGLPEDAIERIVGVTDANAILTDSTEANLDSNTNIVEIDINCQHEVNYVSPKTDTEDTALILFTSGTTGNKKGVVLSHQNLIQTSKYINEFMGVDRAIKEHVMVPIYHSFGFARTRCIFLKKGTVVLEDGNFNPLLAFERLREFDCDAISGVPSIMAMLIELGESRFSEITDQIQYVEIGSSPMPASHKKYLISNLPNARICMHYGLTEASRTCFIEFSEESEKLDSVGRPSPSVDVKILDENGTEVPDGEIGEITVKGPNVAKSYLPKSITNKDAQIGEWFNTGDTGYKDEDGYIHFKGRRDSIINIGGEKVAPLEIEELIRGDTDFEPGEFCIVGKEAEIYGQVPILCTTDETFANNDLQELNRELLSSGLKKIFRPRDVVHLDRIPRTDNGKILRTDITIE